MRERSESKGSVIGDMTRREFLTRTGAAIAGLAVAGMASASEEKKAAPVRIGSGYYTYELVEGWGQLPPGMHYGWGCGVVVDARDRVYVHTRSQQAVVVFDRHGKILTDWGAEFAQNGHGLYWSKEGPDEFLYFTTNAPGNTVVKTDLSGRKLLTIGNVPEESSTSIKFPFDNPTDVAIAPNGDIYVCEGYGSQLIHRFTADGSHRQTIGGPGTAPDKFNICHGIWVDTRNNAEEPEIYIADRSNGRLQVFSSDLKFRRSLKGEVRNPCCFYTHKGKMYIPDLDHRVTILDQHDQVLAQLGDGRGKDNADDPGVFRAPHALTVDSHGDMYVVEWLDWARLRKFKNTPQPS